MAQSTATSKRQGKIAAELTLLWPILRRWPGGYSFGEYLNGDRAASDQVASPDRGRLSSKSSSAAANGPALAGPRAIQRGGCCVT
jgi:hypothetical protein